MTEPDEDEDYDQDAMNIDDDEENRHWIAIRSQLRVLAESAGLVLRDGHLYAG